MKVVSFDYGQQGEEWLTWRKGGIGASDIGVLMGTNSYSSAYKLWEIKCGYRQEDELNPAMRHGIAHEDIARQWLNEHYQLNLRPLCVEDVEHSEFRASLDGYDFDHQTLVEIKCPINENTIDKARMSQAIPDHWLDQVQWQIMLTNPKRAMIAVWDYRNKSCITLDVFGMKERIEKMRLKAKDFWYLVQSGKEPEPGPKDFVEVEAPELEPLLWEYKELIDKEMALAARKKELREGILKYTTKGSFTAYGFKVQQFSSPARYDWDQIRMAGIDLERFKKKSAEGFYRIFPPKGSIQK